MGTIQRTLQRTVKEQYKVSPFYAFFLIHSVQFGIDVLQFQQKLVKMSGNDSWMPIIFAGVIVHVYIWIIFKILSIGKGDLIGIQFDVFGKWFGGFLSLIWILYFTFVGIIVIRTYIQVIQVWMFPEIGRFLFSMIFLTLIYYLVTGGFRVVAGISFLSVIIPLYIIFTFAFALKYSHFQNILPLWNHSADEILMSSVSMLFSYLGFSVLLLYYPYLNNPKKAQWWSHGGNFLTLTVYTLLMLLSIAYFGVNQLANTVWPTLNMWKIVELPFVQRFEYVGISSWIIVILPNICLTFWAASRGLRQLFKINQRKALIGILVSALASNLLIGNMEHIEKVSAWIYYLGIALVFMYTPILLVLCILKYKRRKKS